LLLSLLLLLFVDLFVYIRSVRQLSVLLYPSIFTLGVEEGWAR
jgi:hypothetical protein